MRRSTLGLALAALVLAVSAAPAAASGRAYNILPPGQFGGLPRNGDSLDQLPLYDGLTPLRAKIGADTIGKYFKSESFSPIGKATTIATGNKDLKLVRDRYGVPHIYGRTRAATMFGAGFAMAQDRTLLLQLAGGASRVAVADVPGVNAFGLVTSGKTFVPSKAAEGLVTEQRKLIETTYKAEGRQVITDLKNYARGVNAEWKKAGVKGTWTVNDAIATTAFIGSIFGSGGGGELNNANLLARLRQQFGFSRGTATWRDLMEPGDPEATTSIPKHFSYGQYTGGRVTGSVVPDAGSIQSVPDPSKPKASNFLLVSAKRSKTGDPMAVMGPQLGYYYPEIVTEQDLHGPGILSQGAAVPGGGPYTLIGRTKNYAWSLTTATHDLRDVYAEELCEPDGSAPTRASKHYLFNGKCRAMGRFDAGTLKGNPDSEFVYSTTIHGPVIGTATVGGKPYAMTRKRSSYGRDGLNLAAMKAMTEGKASTPDKFYTAASRFNFSFNWAYVSRQHIAYFSSGRLPKRARGLNRFLPTLGTGKYEWKGYLSRDQHPHQADPPSGIIVNWNNQSAPGFMHGDNEQQGYGSVHRVELLKRNLGRRQLTLEQVVGAMNKSATTDLRATDVWPDVARILAGSPGPDARTERAARLVTGWRLKGAPRLDLNGDGKIDDPGAAILDRAMPFLLTKVMQHAVGADNIDALRAVITRDNGAQKTGSSFGSGWYGYVDKDLRTLYGSPVKGKFSRPYCGDGDLATCRAELWSAMKTAADSLAAEQGGDPGQWRASATAERISFVPGLIPDVTMRWTNRPTFQQVIEFGPK